MNSYVGMMMVKKEQGQGDYFSQQSILLTLSVTTRVFPMLQGGMHALKDTVQFRYLLKIVLMCLF